MTTPKYCEGEKVSNNKNKEIIIIGRKWDEKSDTWIYLTKGKSYTEAELTQPQGLIEFKQEAERIITIIGNFSSELLNTYNPAKDSSWKEEVSYTLSAKYSSTADDILRQTKLIISSLKSRAEELKSKIAELDVSKLSHESIRQYEDSFIKFYSKYRESEYKDLMYGYGFLINAHIAIMLLEKFRYDRFRGIDQAGEYKGVRITVSSEIREKEDSRYGGYEKVHYFFAGPAAAMPCFYNEHSSGKRGSTFTLKLTK